MIAWFSELTRAGENTPARRRFAILLITLSSVAFSFNGLILRAMQDASVWQINFYRGIAQIVTVSLILLAVYGRRTPAAIGGIGAYGLVAALLLGIMPVTFVVAMTHTTVANTLFVIAAVPVITALLAWLALGERVRRGTAIAIAVALAGIALMVADGMASGSLFGNLVALLTALLFSVFAVIMRARRGIDMLPAVALGGVVTCLLSLALSWQDLAISLHDLLLCVLWGSVIAGVFGNMLFVVAVRHLAAAEVTLLMLTEFVLGPLWVWWLVNEVPSAYTLLGGAVVMSAVAGRALADMRRKR